MAFLISAFQIIGALSERAQQMRPPSNASFTTADPRADGQADSRPRGALRAPRSAPPSRPPAGGHPSVSPRARARAIVRVRTDLWVRRWTGAEHARMLGCLSNTREHKRPGEGRLRGGASRVPWRGARVPLRERQSGRATLSVRGRWVRVLGSDPRCYVLEQRQLGAHLGGGGFWVRI